MAVKYIIIIIITKKSLQKQNGRLRSDPIWLGAQTSGWFCEHGTETADFKKCCQFLDWLRRGDNRATETAFG